MYVYDWYFREYRWPGAVQVINCRLCPDAKLKDFEEFKRHCKTSETHPLVIHFCDRCRDYFRATPPTGTANYHPPSAAKSHQRRPRRSAG